MFRLKLTPPLQIHFYLLLGPSYRTYIPYDLIPYTRIKLIYERCKGQHHTSVLAPTTGLYDLVQKLLR